MSTDYCCHIASTSSLPTQMTPLSLVRPILLFSFIPQGPPMLLDKLPTLASRLAQKGCRDSAPQPYPAGSSCAATPESLYSCEEDLWKSNGMTCGSVLALPPLGDRNQRALVKTQSRVTGFSLPGFSLGEFQVSAGKQEPEQQGANSLVSWLHRKAWGLPPIVFHTLAWVGESG